MPEPLLTPDQAAERLHVSTRTLRQLRQRGLIRYVAVTERKLLYRPEDCDEFVAGCARFAPAFAKPASRTGKRTVARSGNVVPIRPYGQDAFRGTERKQAEGCGDTSPELFPKRRNMKEDRMKKLESKTDFEAVAEQFSDSPLVVQFEDSRMGMCNHWTDDVVLVDAYRGDAHVCLRVPFKNFFHLGNGALFAGLKGVVSSDAASSLLDTQEGDG